MGDNNLLDEKFQYLNFDEFLKNFILIKEEIYFLKDDTSTNKDELFSIKGCLDYLTDNILNDDTNTRIYRRVYWALLLGIYRSNDLNGLIKEIEKKRNFYKKDKDEYITKPNNLDIQKLDPQIFHPLCSDDKNPWVLKQKNQELKDEIKQDILRTHSDKIIFQNENIRSILCDILFIWAKKYPSLSYKQGMNEILAIFFIIIYRERADSTCSSYLFENEDKDNISDRFEIKEKKEKYFNIFTFLFDKNEIEADTFIMFDHFLNMSAKYLFSSIEEKKSQASKNTCKTILIQKCTHIFHKLLKNSDKMLYNHLISLSIEPQIFLLRWIRLFYCREFQIDDVIILWDYFFADSYVTMDKTRKEIDGETYCTPVELKGDNVEIAHKTSEIFPLVDYFAISMIIYIRSFLLENDENYCLKRLFKYPPVENIRTLIDLAFKIKSKSEKREKGGKREDSAMTTKINIPIRRELMGGHLQNINSNGTSACVLNSGTNVASPSKPSTINFLMNATNQVTNYQMNEKRLSYNDNLIKADKANNHLSTFEIKHDMKKEKNKEATESNSFFHSNFSSRDGNNLNNGLKEIVNVSNFNSISEKLNQIINNLNMLSISLANERHKSELQQNIFYLKGIQKQLQNWGKKENA